MPKGKTPSLIGSTLGRPKRADVKGSSRCARCGATMAAGAAGYEIPKLGGAFNRPRRYCEGCYARILDQTEKDLQTLRQI